MNKIAILLTRLILVLVVGTALATEAISEGKLERFSYRSNYVLFEINSGSGNSCSACSADPANFSSGGFCWVPDTNKTLVSMLLSAQAQQSNVRARVKSWSQCEVYQLEISD